MSHDQSHDQSPRPAISELLTRFPQDALVVLPDVHLGLEASNMLGGTEPITDGDPSAAFSPESLDEVIRRFLDADGDIVIIYIGDLTGNFGTPGRDPNRTIDEEVAIVFDDLSRQPRSPSFLMPAPVTEDYVDDVREALHDCGA